MSAAAPAAMMAAAQMHFVIDDDGRGQFIWRLVDPEGGGTVLGATREFDSPSAAEDDLRLTLPLFEELPIVGTQGRLDS